LGYANLLINELAAGADQGFSERHLAVALKKAAVNGIVVNININSRYMGEV